MSHLCLTSRVSSPLLLMLPPPLLSPATTAPPAATVGVAAAAGVWCDSPGHLDVAGSWGKVVGE
jgi:hypothetical protein